MAFSLLVMESKARVFRFIEGVSVERLRNDVRKRCRLLLYFCHYWFAPWASAIAFFFFFEPFSGIDGDRGARVRDAVFEVIMRRDGFVSMRVFSARLERRRFPFVSSSPVRFGLAPLVAAILLSGCSVGPEWSRPESDVPTTWRNAGSSSALASAPRPETAATEELPLGRPPTKWWRRFGNEELNGLIERALSSNRGLKATLSRLAQAEAQETSALSALLPQVGGRASGRIDYPSDGFAQPAPGTKVKSKRTYQASLTVSWELDLWGSGRSAFAAAEAGSEAALAEGEAAALSLSAEVAATYFQIAAATDRLALARNQEKTAERLGKALERRAELGEGTRLDVVRQGVAALDVRASVAALEATRSIAMDKLAFLLGMAPANLRLNVSGISGLTAPDVAPGLPSALLERRPDVRKAEAEARAANASIGVAMAKRLPSFSLTGERGLGGLAMSAVGGPQSLFYNLLSSIAMPLLDWGKGSAAVEAARARGAELSETYRQTVLIALRETDDALAQLGSFAEQQAARRRASALAAEAEAMGEKAFVAGLMDLTGLLDARRARFQADDALVQASLGRLSATIDLCKALGGEPSDDADALGRR